MDTNYALRWLDLVVTTILDPAKTNLSKIGPEELENFGSLMRQETSQNKTLLSQAAFRFFSKRKFQRMIGQYHRSLSLLLETAFERHVQIAASSEKAVALKNAAVEAIDELLDFIEQRFGEYIDLDTWVPSAQLAKTKESLGRRLKKLRPWLQQAAEGTALPEIITQALEALISENAFKKRATFREVLYKKELVDQLEQLQQFPSKHRTAAEQITELLVFLNFNSRRFIDYYTGLVAARVRQIESLPEKKGELLLAQRDFNQLHYQSGLGLYTHQTDLRSAVGQWFDAELRYLDSQPQWQISTPQAANQSPQDSAKVLCLLSIDQIALLLRALDSLRIIQARSMNSVFQHIAPYLSTPRKKDISWESMRSKAYQFEESDKNRVLEVLELVKAWVTEMHPQ